MIGVLWGTHGLRDPFHFGVKAGFCERTYSSVRFPGSIGGLFIREVIAVLSPALFPVSRRG